MKKTSIISIVSLLLLSCVAQAAETEIAGPRGGKLLANDPPRAEFFVEKDRTVSITFYDAEMKPVPPTGQRAIVYADAKQGRAKLELEKKGDVLVSKTPLPEGDGYNVMVRLQSSPDARVQNFKINYRTESCPKCKLAEYACICPPQKEHGHEHKPGEEEHGHDDDHQH